jgi:hypothetical protein
MAIMRFELGFGHWCNAEVTSYPHIVHVTEMEGFAHTGGYEAHVGKLTDILGCPGTVEYSPLRKYGVMRTVSRSESDTNYSIFQLHYQIDAKICFTSQTSTDRY